jgi:ribose-phosphate pyrophosphokinase
LLRLYVNSFGTTEIPIKLERFPAGETLLDVKQITLNQPNWQFFRILLEFESNNDLWNLALLVDAIRRSSFVTPEIQLDVPYFPYARQDRVCNKGESLSVKVVADFINGLGFSKVSVFDPHSDVVGALVNNIRISTINDTVARILRDFGEFTLVSPDAGANKKVESVGKSLGIRVIKADKKRDSQTGNVTDAKVYSENLGNESLLVVDDICDGGRTFINLGGRLKEITTGPIYLYVSHGIFSRGIEHLLQIYNVIFCKNVLPGARPFLCESRLRIVS